MPHTRLSLATVALSLCAYIFHGCQQPRLNAREEDIAQAAPSVQTPQSKQGKQTHTTPEPSGATLAPTSSSDSSPDTKHADRVAPNRDVESRSITSAPQSNTLASADGATTITKVSSKEVARKRLANTQLDVNEAQQTIAKKAKNEISFPSYKEWFTAFTQIAAQIEEDSESEVAWDGMEQLLDEGSKNGFLERSITWINDSNPTAQYEYTSLHYAAARGILALVRELVEKRNVSADLPTNGKKNTPLHMAAAGGYLDIVAYLVQQGKVEISKTDHQGASALHYAAAGKYGENNRDVIKYLVEINKEEGTKCTDEHLSVLELAVHADNAPVVAYWLTEFNSKDNDTVKEHIENALKMAKAMPGRETITHLLKGS